jgi:hypothetical protein
MTDSEAAAPFTYRIDVELGVIFLQFGTEQPSFEAWRAAIDALIADPAFRPGLNLVSDRRRLTDAPTTSTLERMASYVGSRRDTFGRCRWAIVTDPQALAEYGMVRMGEVLFRAAGSDIELQPFTEMDAAIRWAVLPH